MGSDEERIARLWQLPLEVVVRYATVTHALVEVAVERWPPAATSRLTCARWVVALSHDADLAA